MMLWPVAGRELQVAARRRMTFLVRLLAATMGVVVLGLIVWQAGRLSGVGIVPGALVFKVLAILSMAYCFFEGLRTTSDCLSEEKREGTLGLLFLTDLSGWDVVLGKLAATSLNSLYGLLAIFPVLSVALSMGGVQGAEFWRMVLVLVDSLIFCLVVGLWCSARSRDAYQAAVAALTTLAAVATVPFLLDRCCSLLSRSLGDACFALVSPIYTVQMAYAADYLTSPARFWESLAVIHLATWALLWNAGRFVARHWQEDGGTSGLAAGWRRSRAGSPRNQSRRSLLRARWLDLNPGLWLDLNPGLWLARHFQGSDWLLWVPAILATAGIVYESRLLPVVNPAGTVTSVNAVRWTGASLLSGLTNVLFCLMIAARSGRCLVESRANGGLELVLGTLLNPEQLIQGQRAALRPLLARLFFVVALVHGYSAVVQMAVFGQVNEDFRTYFTVKQIAGAISFCLDLLALSWVAMWLALTSRGLNQVVFKSFLYVMILPVFGLVFVQILRGGTSISGFHPLSWSFDECLGAIKDLVFIYAARKQLAGRLRSLGERSPGAGHG